MTMRIGIVSDTHGRLPAMQAAMKLLQAAKVDAFIHCGDVCGEAILDCLAGTRAAVVWGNNDLDHGPFQQYCGAIGIECLGNGGLLNWGGKRIFVTHGDDARLLQRTIQAAACDYLLCGHTHVAADQRFGALRLINPGALHRAIRKTAATLDLETDELTHISVE